MCAILSTRSPIGELLLTSDGEALTGLYMCEHRGRPAEAPDPGWRRDIGGFQSVREQLDAYFEGELRDFDLSLRMPGTPFQRLVWEGLRAIPYGSTVSYAELAENWSTGRVRAVGSANGRNPISVVVPCHRVIAADGTLGGTAVVWTVKNGCSSTKRPPASYRPTRPTGKCSTLRRVVRSTKLL